MRRTDKHSIVIAVLAAVSSFAFGGCAEKTTRVWIEPPLGYEASDRSSRNLYYQVEDAQHGKKEVVTIPVDQMPTDLVVEDHGKAKSGEGDAAAATQADRIIAQGKLPDAPAKPQVTVSYLRSLQDVEDLYGKRQFNEALVRIAPLVEQYPSEARLFSMQGTLYRRIGERKLAYQAYRRAHELDKDNAQIEEAYLKLQDEVGGAQ